MCKGRDGVTGLLQQDDVERKMKGCKRVDEEEMCCSDAENRSTNGSYKLQKCQIQTEERGQREIRTGWRTGVFQQHIKIVCTHSTKRQRAQGSWIFK